MGDITNALRTAQSGLITSQQLLNTSSNNIANVNTEGYSRKVTTLKSIVTAGVGGGVSVSMVKRNIDEGLLRNLRIENGELYRACLVHAWYNWYNAPELRIPHKKL